MDNGSIIAMVFAILALLFGGCFLATKDIKTALALFISIVLYAVCPVLGWMCMLAVAIIVKQKKEAV